MTRKCVALFSLMIVLTVLLSGSTMTVRFDYHLSRSRITNIGINEISMIFAGDIMAHDVNYSRTPYTPIYEGIRDLVWNADLSFANLEFVFDPGKDPSSYPYFNAPVEYVEAAVDGGFNVFSLANNHSFDLGNESVLESLVEIEELSNSHRIYFNGIFATDDDRFAPTFFEVMGVRVGFLAVTSFLNRLETSDHINIVPFYNESEIDGFVERLTDETAKADLFILSYHGGIEYKQEPAQWKRTLFRKFVDAGVDIVWGHHPHVVQPWEIIGAPDGRKLILYSTGNLISGQTWRSGPNEENSERNGTGESALFTLDVVVDGGMTSASRVTVVPIFNHRDAEDGMVIKQFEAMAGMEISDEWALYYKDRLSDLETRLVDGSSWSFIR
jgi:poly-gamma-glutamate synthesis protein (capsule biosynthesis protein)